MTISTEELMRILQAYPPDLRVLVHLPEQHRPRLRRELRRNHPNLAAEFHRGCQGANQSNGGGRG